jgi:hypothetical protein
MLCLLFVFALDPRLLTRNDTEILLALTQQQEISGVVMHRGAAVTSGQVRVSVDRKTEDEALGAEHVGTVLQSVGANGAFKVQAFMVDKRQKNERPPSILVRAEYRGSASQTDAKQAESLAANAVLYSNCPTPFSTEELLRGLCWIVGAALVLVYLFTGHLSNNKAQSLFAVTYCFIFLAVSLPIGGLIVISQKPYLIAMMQKSPLGLVKASTKALEYPQWLINVGGVPVDIKAKAAGGDAPDPAPGPDGKAGRGASPSDTELTSTASSDADEVPTVEDGAERMPQRSVAREAKSQPQAASTEAATSQANGTSLKIEGGLVIPFYVLLFAIFGGGINMMRTIPRIQSDHVRNMGNCDTEAKQREIGCDVRKDVIEQYMYLLSAPFLAIAVFYLLQIIATSISEPVLVLMAFSAGLTSELIVSAIIRFAENTVERMRPSEEDSSTHQGAAP